MRTAILFWILLVQATDLLAQDWPQSLSFKDSIHSDVVKTVQLGRKGEKFGDAVIRFQSGENLTLAFDELKPSVSTFQYAIIYCNADWSPSDLFPNQYFQGMQDEFINQYQRSFSTRQPYVHYQIDIPGKNSQFLLPGNYLLYVYRDGDKNKVILTRRLMVYQPLFSLNPILRRTTRAGLVHYKQALDLEINTGSEEVLNPFDQVKVVIRQNSRWDNASTQLKLLYVRDRLLTYQAEGDNVFDGSNEFRRFDIRTTRFKPERVADIGLDSLLMFKLVEDQDRSYLRYSLDPDLNGRCFISQLDGAQNPDTDADYAWVEFTLNFPDRTLEGDFYVLGELSDWNTTPQNRMQFDPLRKKYYGKFLLKQGLFNYLYAFKEKGKDSLDTSITEGAHEETENNYEVLVYFQDFRNPRADRLVGYSKINSLNNNQNRR